MKEFEYAANDTMKLLGKQIYRRSLGETGQTELKNILEAQRGASRMIIAMDAFMLGYIYGQRAERKRRKERHNGKR